MGILKSFVNNRKYPEGNIISRYGTEEAVEWSMTYLDPDNPIVVPHSRHEGRLDEVGTLGKKSMNSERKTYDKAHFLVLEHMEVVEPYVFKHKQLIVQQNPERGEGWVAKKHMKELNNWFKDHVAASNVPSDDIKKLAAGPIFTVMTYQAYDINGYTFYTVQQDKKSIYQNSGVRIDAYDNNMQQAPYYGQVEEIWELNYLEFKVALFKC